MTHIDTAVIAVGGTGSRLFPASYAVEKCLLPIYSGDTSQPIINYVVDDCIQAGIKRIIFVTTARGVTQLSDNFRAINAELKQRLMTLDKYELVNDEDARRNARDVRFEFVVQPPATQGTAAALLAAKGNLQGVKKFAFLSGDDFLYHSDQSSELALAAQAWESAGTDHLAIGRLLPSDKPVNGAVFRNTDSILEAIEYLDEQAEHEQLKLIGNLNKFLLSDRIWDLVDAEVAAESEYIERYITHAINNAVKAGQTCWVYESSGTYIDGGSFAGLLSGSNFISSHPKS